MVVPEIRSRSYWRRFYRPNKVLCKPPSFPIKHENVEVDPHAEKRFGRLSEMQADWLESLPASNDAFENAHGPRERIELHVASPICQRASAQV